MGQIITTASYFSNGELEITGQSKVFKLSVSGTWAAEDQLFLLLNTTLSGLQELIGAGTVTGKEPVFLLTYKKKLYFLAGTDLYFSVINDSASYNRLDGAGNGAIPMANSFSTPENLVALAPFQGRLAVFGRGSTQIWTVAADPAAYSQEQVLNNIGTFAPLSVQSLGELDVFFLHETGIRSLRVRDSTLNAFSIDIGSPIDLLVAEKLAGATETQRAAACGIVEPSSGRYWLFLKDTIYVLSYFPSAKVTAWCTYKPSYQAANLFRVRSGSPGTVHFRIGMTNAVDKATFVSAGLVNGGTENISKAGVYVWVTDPDGAVLSGPTTIPGGVAFRGEMVSDGAYAVSFTSNQTAFVPQKFFSFNGKVYARTADGLVMYGGTSGESFDNAVASLQLPWLDGESPDTVKKAMNIVASLSGTWDLFASMDYLSEEFTEVLNSSSAPTYDGGKIPFSSRGTHFSFLAVTNDNERAVLSALMFNYDKG